MEELEAIPTLEEIGKAIDSLTYGKAPGNDGIPQTGSSIAIPPFCSLCMTPFVKFWGAGGVPQDTRDARIVTLYKNKGDRSNCNSYRGISFLSIVGKLYARVLLVHPQQLAECVYPESEGSMSRPFDIKSGVKQGCVLAPTLFEVLFSPLL